MLRSVLALCAVAAPLTAQGRVVPAPSPADDTVTAAPAPRYQAGPLHRVLLGSDWRDLWATPVPLPVLRVDTFAGGLTPEREGGNRQSITLHFVDAAGDGWVFRSLDKYPEEKIGLGGFADWLLQDQISAFLPAAELVVPPLLDALDILHVEPRLYVMPDDPALGEFRERFAGMIGAIELKPDEREGDTPGFAGSRKTVNTENMFDRLEDSPVHRVDERELLRARLLDFIINDTDRTTDQWRFSRFPDPRAPRRFVWRPVPRDRDFALHSADGLVLSVAGGVYPKFARFGHRHASITTNTYSTHVVDRGMLTRIRRDDVDAEVAAVRERLTDAVIADAVGRLPETFPAETRQRLIETLRARRDRLDNVATAFYEWLATEVDVRATDHDDRAVVTRRPDGRVEVVLAPLPEAVVQEYQGDLDEAPPATAEPYYRRVFLPTETREVRVYLHGGDDVATVEGPQGAIRVRIIGGGGDDTLEDRGGGAYLYDHRGDNRFVPSRGTRIDEREWTAPDVPEGIRMGSDWAPDWGGSRSWSPHAEYGEYAGIVLGIGPERTRYGFRRLPHHWSVTAQPLIATGAGRFGARAGLDYRFENSFHSVEVGARWVDFDAIRWYGAGNDTPLVDDELSLVPLSHGRLDPALVLRFGAWRDADEEEAEDEDDEADEDQSSVLHAFGSGDDGPPRLRVMLSLGPILGYVDPRPRAGGPYALDPTADRSAVWEAGGRAALELRRTDGSTIPRRGFRLRTEAQGYPLAEVGAFGTVTGEANLYLPVPGPAHLALRAGGQESLGAFPPWHAAAIGGRATLRGFRFQRFAGDRSAYGGAELRLPLADVELLTHGQVGVFGLVDAGRVWVDGESPGGWHTALGGGFWVTVLGQPFTAAFASGERDQIYFSMGLFY